MKRLKYFIIALLALCLIIPPAWAGTAKQMKYGIRFVDEGAAHDTPPSGYGELYVNSDALYFIDDSGTATDVIATTSETAWDDLAVPDANESLNMGAYYTEWTFADTDHDMLSMYFTGAFGDVSGMVLQQKTGAPTDGTLLELIIADTSVDLLSAVVVSTEMVNIDSSGNLTLASGSASAITKVADGAGDDFTLSLTGAQNSSLLISSAGVAADAIAIAASAGGLDISSAGAGYDIDITATGGRILGVASEAAADQFKIDAQGEIDGDAINLETTNGGIMINADGAAYGDIEVNAADDLSLVAAGTVSIDSADWDISAAGAVTNIASLGFDSSTIIYHDTVELTSAQIMDLADTPISLVATPGAHKFIEFISAVLILDYGSNVFAESADNLVIEYSTSGADVTGAIEMTGFIEQTCDQMAFILASGIATDAASDIVNNGLQLFNTSDDFTGNAGGDNTMTVKIAYRIHADGLE